MDPSDLCNTMPSFSSPEDYSIDQILSFDVNDPNYMLGDEFIADFAGQTKNYPAEQLKYQEEKEEEKESNYRGVMKRKSGKYGAEIRVSAKERVWLGTFDTAKSAAVAYDEVAYALRESSAKLNFPKDVADYKSLKEVFINEKGTSLVYALKERYSNKGKREMKRKEREDTKDEKNVFPDLGPLDELLADEGCNTSTRVDEGMPIRTTTPLPPPSLLQPLALASTLSPTTPFELGSNTSSSSASPSPQPLMGHPSFYPQEPRSLSCACCHHNQNLILQLIKEVNNLKHLLTLPQGPIIPSPPPTNSPNN